MANTKCTCGAPMAKHPGPDSQYAYPCLEALRASNVRCACDWPGCDKKARKWNLGHNFCPAHKKAEWNAFMTITAIEGPAGLMRGTPTLEECVYMYQTKQMPPSRLAPMALKDSHIHCALCSGPLIVLNPPNWQPGDPDVVDGKQVSIGICPKCLFNKQAVA